MENGPFETSAFEIEQKWCPAISRNISSKCIKLSKCEIFHIQTTSRVATSLKLVVFFFFFSGRIRRFCFGKAIPTLWRVDARCHGVTSSALCFQGLRLNAIHSNALVTGKDLHTAVASLGAFPARVVVLSLLFHMTWDDYTFRKFYI